MCVSVYVCECVCVYVYATVYACKCVLGVPEVSPSRSPAGPAAP